MSKRSESDWEVYIVEAENGKLYTGIAKDSKRRFEEHMSSPKGAKFFRSSKPKEILYCEKQPNRSEASKREAAIKKLSRKQKLLLVEQGA
jgi:putative endonuclease